VKSKLISTISTAALLSLAEPSFAQGFTNLNFENAIIQTNLGTTFYVDPAKAIPGWTAYLNGNAQSVIGYDTVSLGGAAVFLEDSNAPGGGGPLPIQGSYSVYLEGASTTSGSDPTTASIGQTGTIPNTAQSLTFYLGDLYGTFQVSFNGQPLSFTGISNTLNYTIWGADVSAYAGQTGQLLFSAQIRSDAVLDNIQFSSLPVPEPSEFVLAALGGLFLGFSRRRR
jgi:hypothetical protein